MILITSNVVAEQSDRPPLDKAELIVMMKKMRTANQLEVSQIDHVLASLDYLSAADQRDTALLRELHELSAWCMYDENTEQAKQLMFKKKAFLESEGLKKSMMYEWQVLAEIYILEGKMDSARWYLNKAEAAWAASGNTGDDPYILSTRALWADKIGNYLEASQLMVKTIDLFNQRNLGLETATAQLNLSRIYMVLGMHHKSIKLAKEAYQYFRTSGTERQMLMAGNNIASIYKLMDSLTLSIRWNRENIALARRINHEVELARSYMNLGNSLSRAGNYTEAELYLDSSLMIANKLGLGYGVMLHHINKANHYLRMKMPEAVLRELQSVKKLNEIYGDAEVRLGYYEAMYKVNEQLKRYEEAYTYYKLSDEIKDSLDQKQATHFLLEWEQLIEKERAAKEIAELNLAVSKSKFQNVILIGTFIVLGLLAFLWFRRRVRLEQEKNKLAGEEQKRLAEDMDMKNRELASKAIQQASLMELIDDIIRKLKQFTGNIKKESVADYMLLIRDLEMRKPEEAWLEFETRFTQVHEDFHEKLLRLCPDLSPSELKVCSLLRLNLSTKEIAALTNRSKATIVNTRSIIRKKLNLVAEDNLIAFLLTL